MKVPVGRVEDVPEDRCVAVADGAAVVVRRGEEVLAFRNRCLHKDSPLAGGRVWDDGLTCPMHFWRYRLPSGVHTGGRGALPSYATEIDDHGTVLVELPDAGPPMTMRERLLAHARDWERDR